MRFTKPLWLSHASEKKEHEVYSCHVSPDGSRLVTAGGDQQVRIWSTEAIQNASNSSYTKPKQLASLSHHTGTVHSVRFSPNGKYLASGADDKLVCVYHLDPTPPTHTTFGSKEEPAVENWRVYRRLFGHDNDVQDVGWSYDSSILVSVGLDSKVVVWSGSTFEKLKTLSQHQSHVKGICFDPANKYFATASDDRSIRIYRFTPPAPNATAYDQTSNFTLETTITKPFLTSPLTTYFRRCSWSPDGNHIAAANAVNGLVSSVAIIERGTWTSDISLLGHEGPVEVCLFCPRTMSREPVVPGDDKGPVKGNTIVACAGQDKTLTIWNTSMPRPFVTTAELCAKSVSDLAWNPAGDVLYLTSLDGTIAAIFFEKGELGYPLPKSEDEKHLAKFGAGRRVGIVENADALLLEEGSKAGELRGAEGRMGELMGDTTSTLATNGTNGDTHTKANADTNGVATPEPTPAPKDPNADKIEKIKQRITITKDGRKRIAPMLVSSANQGMSNIPRPELQAAVRLGSTVSDEPAGKTLDLSKPYDGLPKGGIAALLLGNKRKYADTEGDEPGEKRTEKRVNAIQQNGATPIVHNTADGLVPASSSTAPKNDLPDVLRPAVIDPSMTVAQTRLAIPAVRSTIVRPLDTRKSDTDGDAPDADADVTFEARNATGPARTGRAQDRDPCRITVSRRGQTLWQDFLPRAVLLVTGNLNFWAAACEDGTLHLWTPAGRRMASPIVLAAQPVIIDCRGWFLLAITSVGQAYVWDIRTMTALHPPVSLAPILDLAAISQQGHLTQGPALMFARLNSQGRIVAAMSNGDGFAYNPSMYSWQRLSEPWWAVGSQYWNTKDSGTSFTASRAVQTTKTPNGMLDDINPENISAGIIPLLERNTTSQALLKGRAFFLQKLVKQLLSAEGYEGFEAAISIAHLENRVAAAMTLGAKDEFKVALIMYAKRIGSEGLRGKVEELLRGLLGKKLFEQDGDHDGGDVGVEFGSADYVVGWPREELARDVITVLGKHRDLQRITVPYARLLGVLEEDAPVAMITES